MKAEDIDLRSLLEFQPESGRLMLGAQRMLIFSQSALGILGELLVERLGHELADALLTQFGYRCGADDYEQIAAAGDWDSDTDRLASGPMMHMWEGLVHVEPTLIEFDRAAGDFQMTGIWRNSYEAENHMRTAGHSDEPVCMSLTGYASGWASSFFASDLVAVENTCQAQGHDHCTFEIRPWAQWDSRADRWREALMATSESVSSMLEGQVAARTRELEEANLVLALARDAAEKAGKAKMQFLANVSHELRTPMNGVLGVAELLAESDLNPDQRQLVELVIESGGRQVEIISDLLDFSKIEAGLATRDERAFDVPALIGKVVGPYRAQAHLTGVRLDLDITDSVPGRVISDQLKISQILANILSNAVKFTPADGRVSVTVSGAADELRITVADTGIGMSPEQVGRVFSPFAQADESITRRYGGTGLGLAICEELVGILNGRLEVSSVEGQGSTFVLTVPVRPVPEPSTRAGLPAGGSAAADLPRAGDREQALAVLVAEDNSVNAMVISAILSKLNCRALVAPDGKRALQAYDDGQYGLVLLDLHMPELDGLQVLEGILERQARAGVTGPPVVALTADAYDETRHTCIAAGFSVFRTTPAATSAVARVVADARERGSAPAAGRLS